MLPNKETLKFGLDSFRSLSKTNNFTYEAFEERAEELEKQLPGTGYQLAYNESLIQTFRSFVDKLLSDDKPQISFSDLINCFDKMLINPYIRECKAQGVAVNLHPSLTPDMLTTFSQILENNPNVNVFHHTARKFEHGEITLDSAYADAKNRANTVPTKKEALELVSRAAFLEARNKERGFWNSLFNFRTFFKELFAISAMKKLASKAGDIKELEYEARNGSREICMLKDQVDYTMLKTQATSDQEVDLERFHAMEDKELERFFADIAFSKLVDANHADLKENGKIEDSVFINHDVTVDLEDIDDSFALDHSASEGEFLADESVIADDAPIELDGDDKSDLASLADALDEASTEAERISLVIQELSENANTAERSSKIKENPSSVKEKVID